MEVAWHMAPDGGQDIEAVYGTLTGRDRYLTDLLAAPDRIYVGDEFCETRLPDPAQLARHIQYAEDRDLALTLLTPVLTDPGIERIRPLLDTLYAWQPSAEVVINDLGVMVFLKTHYPKFSLSMGRLFNKGFKDPRLRPDDLDPADRVSPFFQDSSFQHENIQVLADGLGVQRLEQDLLPYADPQALGCGRLETTVYLPFGYVTTGRVCFTAGLDRPRRTSFGLARSCTQPCVSHCLEMAAPDLSFRLFQKGNTVFYLYTLSRLKTLVQCADDKGFRLVCQFFDTRGCA